MRLFLRMSSTLLHILISLPSWLLTVNYCATVSTICKQTLFYSRSHCCFLKMLLSCCVYNIPPLEDTLCPRTVQLAAPRPVRWTDGIQEIGWTKPWSQWWTVLLYSSGFFTEQGYHGFKGHALLCSICVCSPTVRACAHTWLSRFPIIIHHLQCDCLLIWETKTNWFI